MFDWDEANISHIAVHNVLPHEAEEAATFKPVALYAVSRNGEERLSKSERPMRVEYCW
jgi:hypothetical protein